MGNVEITVRDSGTLSRDPELAALNWLIKFIQAEPADLTDLFSLKSGFGDFIVTARESGTKLFPPMKRGEIKRLESFHAQFKGAFHAVLEGRGQRAARIKLGSRDVS